MCGQLRIPARSNVHTISRVRRFLFLFLFKRGADFKGEGHVRAIIEVLLATAPHFLARTLYLYVYLYTGAVGISFLYNPAQTIQFSLGRHRKCL